MSERDHGPQPLDALMEKWGLSNHELVETSTEQLTHKQVQKARKGRQMTLKMMIKVNRAFNITLWYKMNDEQKEAFVEYGHKDLFSYAKGYDPDAVDANDELAAEMKAGS